METFRYFTIPILSFLAILDLTLTYLYLRDYKKWQPRKDFKHMEKNPLILYFIKEWGLGTGMILVSILILFVDLTILLYLSWFISLLLGIMVFYALYNHNKNFNKLNELKKKYPKGYIPKK